MHFFGAMVHGHTHGLLFFQVLIHAKSRNGGTNSERCFLIAHKKVTNTVCFGLLVNLEGEKCQNFQSRSFCTSSAVDLRVCLVHFAKMCKDVNMAFEVLNEVYLQNFLHRWIVNRETNLMMLINPCLINN